MISIVLADDHGIMRQGLRALLEAEPDFCVTGEAPNGLAAVEIVEELKPDILLLDLTMPGLNGLDVTRRLSSRAPKTRIIILSMHASESYVLEALRNGASGYVLKDAGATELVEAVRQVARGRYYMSRPISEPAMLAYVEKARSTRIDIYQALTHREREVLHLTVEGHTSTQIGARLSISARTVETHRNNVLRKLNVHSQRELIVYAKRRGLLGEAH